MAERKRNYMNYLSDPSASLPRSTQYLHKKRTRNQYCELSKEPTPCETASEIPSNSNNQSSQHEALQVDFQSDVGVSSMYDNIFHVAADTTEIECDLRFNEISDNDSDLPFDSFGTEFEIEYEDEEDYVFDEDISDEDSMGYIYDGAEITLHELAVLLITMKTTFNLSAIAIDFFLKILRLALPKSSKSFSSLKYLYHFFESKEIEMRRHFYCSNCLFYIGVTKPTDYECPVCKKKKFQYFVDILLENEIQKVVTNNYKHLNHRFQRGDKQNTEIIRDIYDGRMYKKYFDNGNFLSFRNNISLLGNTDGVAIFKSSAFSVWPIYMVINELPPNIRFRRENRILCGLWFGKEKPNFQTFFKPFTETLWKLYTEGFIVKDEDGKDQMCKAMLLQMTCDSPAKCLFQDFIQFNGYYGCPYCLHSGVYDKTGHCQTYPYIKDSENGHADLRTHNNTIEFARVARSNIADGKKKYAEKGVKGMSWGFSLPNFDIINSMCLDYMHAVLLGVMKHLLNFWFNKDKNEIFSISKKAKEVQERLMQIKPPNNITRSPRTLDDLKHWKASEYRSFLLFYGPACLHGILQQPYYDHFMLLSSAVWLLLKEEISQVDLKTAVKHLQYFCFQMSALYGDSSMSFSVHLLLHLPTTVMQNGPLWCQSCFWFEDYNGELRQFFHSSQHPDSQVARAVHIVQKLPEMVKLMDPDSAAASLQRKMTSDRYKVKLLKSVQKGISVVGKAEEATCTDHAQLHELIYNKKPFYMGTPSKYKRALIYGEMFHSKLYQKVSQRNSFTIEFSTSKEYGEILFFIGLNEGVDEYGCTISDEHFAVVNKFSKIKLALTKDKTTGTSGRHLVTLERQRKQDVILVPLSEIHGKVVFIDVEGLDFTVAGCFPNRIEKD